MKRFLQTERGNTFLHLLRKKQLATFAALLCLMAMMPLTAKAETINIVSSHEELTKTSTVYVGEVVVDGVSEIKYLYSSDVTLYSVVRQNLLDGLNGMADGDYADLLAANWPNNNPPEAFAFCSDATLAAAMDANWSSALYVGMLYFSDKTVASEINSNMYDIDNGFKAALDAQIADRMATIDTIIEAEKCIVSILDATARNIVYYKVVDGEIIKYIHTLVTYSAEATTVIYTKVELETPMIETPLTFEAVEEGTITVNLDDETTLEAIQYKLNDAEWTDVSWNTPIALAANDNISFRGDNGTCNEGEDTWVGFHFEPSNPVYVYGNMMSLIDKDNFETNTTLTETYTFFHLFQRSDYEPNTAILNHPTKDIVLPATTLAPYCYDGLFADAPNITRAPELPATTLTDWCYSEMFSGTAITTAPALPATTLAEACYADMFMNCTNLTTAPDLPAAVLVEGCYTGMFAGCTSLNYVKCLATDISADYCTSGWMWDVAATGTFVKAAGMTDWTIGENGIPEGWTVEDPYTTPLTLEAISDGEITFVYENPYLISLTDIEYQKNGGEWTTYTWNDPIAVVSGDKVAFRGNNETYSGNGTSVGRIVSTADVYVYGNVMSLIHAEDFATNFTLTGSSNFASLFRAGFDYTTFSTIPNTTIQNHLTKDIVLPATTLTNMCYMGMFSGCQGLTRAPELPATEMTVACYAEMFSTTGLTQAPVLPCTEMTPYSYDPETWEESGSIDCYMSMFQNCVNLMEAPALPATTLVHGVYQFMFNGCTSLTTAPELPATDLTGADQCYTEMFEGCTSLEECPELPATTLDAMCYAGMFSGCTSLTEAPALPATTLAEDCYHRMFEGCTSLTTAPELPAATLIGQCYGGMFDRCTSLQYVKCLATDLGEYDGVYFSIADWLSNVAPTGTFIKAPDMEDWPLDSPHGIPEGWTTYDQIFQTEGDWNVAANWNTNAVPAAGSNVVIEANATIPSDYIANVGSVFVDGEATLTIEDGGQLYHNNTGVMATVEKNISAYNTTSGTNNGWHLIGYSFAENGAVEGMTNLLANEYDLYYYDEPTHYWKNYKNAANNFTELEVARGYLYANNTDVTLGLTGTLRAATEMVTLPLSYTDDIPLAGFNLVGNPFTHNVTSFTGTNIAAEVYRMNDTKDNLMVSEVSATNPLLPGEGFFVKATDDDASITFNSRATDAERSLSLSKGATLQLEISQNGLIVDHFILKRDGAPLEKLTLNENSTRIFATKDAQDYAVVVIASEAKQSSPTEQAISFKAEKNGTYTLRVNVENMDLDYLHLIDNMTGADVDLLALRQAQEPAEYTFTAKTTDYESRFRLVFNADDASTGSASDEVFAYIHNGNIVITADARGASLQVIDMMGRVIISHNGHTRCVPTMGMPAGVYVLQLIDGDSVKTQKIVVD